MTKIPADEAPALSPSGDEAPRLELVGAEVDGALAPGVYPALVRARMASGWSEEDARRTPAGRRTRLTRGAVRAACATTTTAAELARKLRVSTVQARRIRAGLSWKD